MDKSSTPERIRRSFVENLYVASKFGNNWIVHGGRSLSDNGNVIVLGDAYCFHFPTGEWARLDPIADTDPRFGHCGACIDGAFSHVFRHEKLFNERTKT